ncbi:hypothetical protein [Embleya sp. NPDC059237]|uniref:hypothetical protein n=1 Tax=Embleya sp. NPDC059237 TaxID=3346784 RepID=UPI00368D516B
MRHAPTRTRAPPPTHPEVTPRSHNPHLGNNHTSPQAAGPDDWGPPAPIVGWIWGRNPRTFLEPLSHYAGYAIDWETVEAGVRVTGADTPGIRLRADTLPTALAAV